MVDSPLISSFFVKSLFIDIIMILVSNNILSWQLLLNIKSIIIMMVAVILIRIVWSRLDIQEEFWVVW